MLAVTRYKKERENNMENLSIYNRAADPPKTALRPIQAGRLKGKTDINPMWRIKQLTEEFGPVGIGWYYNITKQWTEPGAKGEICAFVNIELYIKVNDEWSKPIHGTGGSMLVEEEKKGLHTSDECYKMALTDAISVACKALGFGANIYWQGNSDSKYSRNTQPPSAPAEERVAMTAEQRKNIEGLAKQVSEEYAMPIGDIFSDLDRSLSHSWTDSTAQEAIAIQRGLAKKLRERKTA